MENYIVINGKKAELTIAQLEALGITIKDDPFERKYGESYYCIERSNGGVFEAIDKSTALALERYNVANYCRDKKLMEQRALHETLSRLLWRYSMQHDGDKLDWNNIEQVKYYIYKNCFDNDFVIGDNSFHKKNDVYFYSKDIAKKAIIEIIKPFMNVHPDFVW